MRIRIISGKEQIEDFKAEYPQCFLQGALRLQPSMLFVHQFDEVVAEDEPIVTIAAVDFATNGKQPLLYLAYSASLDHHSEVVAFALQYLMQRYQRISVRCLHEYVLPPDLRGHVEDWSERTAFLV